MAIFRTKLQHFVLSARSSMRCRASLLQSSLLPQHNNVLQNGTFLGTSASFLMRHPQQHRTIERILIRRAFSGTSSEQEEEEEEEEEPRQGTGALKKLEPIEFKNYEMNQLRSMEEDGRMILRPFYQRGYRWTQKQASLWIESVLRGYPCLPELTLLQTEDIDGETQYATFDGQQRLTSLMLFIKNERGDHWKSTKKQKSKNTDASFALEALPMMGHLEDKTFKDLSKREKNLIKNYNVRCAIIPSSWSMEDYIEFFKRIQGGGTPMSDHELRRAISRGPFTELLDNLAESNEIQQAFAGCDLAPDDIQQLLLRYFSLKSGDVSKFGKPTLAQQGLETMKKLNAEMGSWTLDDSLSNKIDLVRPLLESLALATFLFNANEQFRRVAPLIKGKQVLQPTKVWMNSTKLSCPVFVCVVYCLAKDSIRRKHAALRQNRDAARLVMIHLMQTDPAFTDSLRTPGTSVRLTKMEAALLGCLENIDGLRDSGEVSSQTRRDLIASARAASQTPACPLCSEHLSPFDEHLHIDHIIPRAKGGTSQLNNLQVVHKLCNLKKSDKLL